MWTLEKKGEKPNMNVSFDEAIPTKTHLALKALVDAGYVKYIISQNIDGLHLKSGLERRNLSELHGNMFVEECDKCKRCVSIKEIIQYYLINGIYFRQYVRTSPAPTVGKKRTGDMCRGSKNSRPCRGGYLIDNILDWEHDLPDRDLDMSYMHSWYFF